MTSRLYAAEFIFPGHPDKLSDAIADALVLAAYQREERALVGVEVAVHRNRVFVTGRIACKDADTIDVSAIVREVYRSAGYGKDWYPALEALVIESDLCVGPLEEGEAASLPMLQHAGAKLAELTSFDPALGEAAHE